MSDAAGFALIIRSTSAYEVIEFAGHSPASLDALYRVLDTPSVAVIDLSPELSVWLNEEGVGGAHNPAATAVRTAIATGGHDQDDDQDQDRHDHYGTAVFTGIDSRDHTAGLTLDTCHALLKLAGIDAPSIPGMRRR